MFVPCVAFRQIHSLALESEPAYPTARSFASSLEQHPSTSSPGLQNCLAQQTAEAFHCALLLHSSKWLEITTVHVPIFHSYENFVLFLVLADG